MGKSIYGSVVRVSTDHVLQLTVLAEGLDPIRVIVENFGESNQGMITITCYGKAWTAYWGAMGNRSVHDFFLSCDAPYLVGCLVQGMTPSKKCFVASDEAYLAHIVTAVQQAFRNTRRIASNDADAASAMSMAGPRDTAPFYVLPREYGHSMVKDGDFFRSQGGLKDDWGKHWIPVHAESIEDARRLADRMVTKQQSPIWNSDAPGGNP
jgi:hypothetical protein